MLQIIGITLATLICFVLLKDKAPQFALLISICGVVIILSISIIEFSKLTKSINEIVSSIPNSISYVKLMVKLLLIIIITQIVTDICRDNGENAIASTVEISSKTVVIAMVFPLFKTVINLILGIIKWKDFCYVC